MIRERMATEQQLDLGVGIDLENPEMGLPVANAENKQLEAEVQRKEREISALQRQAEHLRDRVQAMEDHLKNVQQELQETQVSGAKPGFQLITSVLFPYNEYQGLYGARKRDLETEHHFKQIGIYIDTHTHTHMHTNRHTCNTYNILHYVHTVL